MNILSIKKTIVLLSVTLTACTVNVGSKSQEQATTTTSTTVKATTTTEAPIPTTEAVEFLNRTDLFLNYIHENTALDLYYDDATIIGIAETICEGAESGLSGEQIIEVILEAAYQNGLTDSQISDMAVLAGTGVATFCPEYTYIFN
jgi:hypothetical protein